jgi:stalled ribosome rescue protein Dom34
VKHAVIWIDHKEARIVKLDDESPRYGTDTVKAHTGHHDKGHGHVHADAKYLEDLARRLSAFEEVVVTGPGPAKDELVAFIESKHPAWRAKIVKVETSDHPTDGQLADHGRKILKAADRMHGVHVR